MAPDLVECEGSWRPVPHMEPGDPFVCDRCKRQVYLRPAPLDLRGGRWPGTTDPRIEPHSPAARAVASVAEVPGSEG
jgi:hypothetical protein